MLVPYLHKNLTEAGLDEAGRGCYAGPVFAAAVILPKDFHHPLLNDSKQLNEKQRDLLRPIIEKECISFAVASVDNDTIDKINTINDIYILPGQLPALPTVQDIIITDAFCEGCVFHDAYKTVFCNAL